MHTLHIMPSYLPPSQIWLYNLLRHARGLEHHIASIDFLSNDFHHPGFHFVPNDKAYYRREVLKLPLNSIQNYAKLIALQVWKWRNGTEIEQWEKYIHSHNIDIIHCHFAQIGCRYADLAARTKKPLIVSFYGHDYEQIPNHQPKYRDKYQLLFKQADRFICEGPHGKNSLIKMGCAADKITILPLGVDSSNTVNVPAKSKKTGNLRLLQVADFTFKKGQLAVIEVMSQILSKNPELDISLTLVGGVRNESYFQQCMNQIEHYQLHQSITYRPFVAYEKLPELFAKHDFFIHPSEYAPDGDCEGGAPVILLDAQLHGLPVIATRHCDIPNVVAPESQAFLVAEKDIDLLQEPILRAYNMPPEEYQLLSSTVTDFVRDNFDIHRLSAQLVGVYEEVIVASTYMS